IMFMYFTCSVLFVYFYVMSATSETFSLSLHDAVPIYIIILSDRMVSAQRIPVPSLLACAAVHHHLIRTGLRTSVGLVVESGEPRDRKSTRLNSRHVSISYAVFSLRKRIKQLLYITKEA